jgi:hypothetical protein
MQLGLAGAITTSRIKQVVALHPFINEANPPPNVEFALADAMDLLIDHSIELLCRTRPSYPWALS